MKALGLNLDDAPLIAENQSLTYARNIIALDQGASYGNEYGFDKKININDVDGVKTNVCGIITTNIGFVVFSTTRTPEDSNGIDYIQYFENVDDEITLRKRISSIYLNFNVNHPITGDYTYNYKKQLIITFTEGVNTDANESRIININNPTYDDNTISENNPFGNTVVSLNRVDSSFLNITPDIIYPNLKFSIISDGNMKTGAYQIAIRYKLKDDTYTNYSILHRSIIIAGDYEEDYAPGINISKSIKVEFTNPDNRYSTYQLAIVYIEEEGQTVYQTEDIILEANNSIIISNIDSYETISLEDIFVNKINYIKDACQINFNNRLYRGNIKTLDYTGFDTELQNISNNISVNSIHTLKQDIINTSIGYFKVDEVYSLYIGYFDIKGSLINIYRIPNKDSDSTESYGTNRDHLIKGLESVKYDIPNITITEREHEVEELIIENPEEGQPNEITVYNATQYADVSFTESKVSNLLTFENIVSTGIDKEVQVPNGHNCLKITNQSNSTRRISFKLNINIRPDIAYTNYITIYKVDSNFNKTPIHSGSLTSGNNDVFTNITINPADTGIYYVEFRFVREYLEVSPDDWPSISTLYTSATLEVNTSNNTVQRLTFTLPTIPSTVSNIVSSYAIFMVEHNQNNSRILSQAIALRDTNKNDFGDNQQYSGWFGSSNKTRLYPFEYLFNTKNVIRTKFKSFAKIGYNDIHSETNNVVDNLKPTFGRWEQTISGVKEYWLWTYARAYVDIAIEDLNITNSDVITNDIATLNYINANNSTLDNIASDSFYRHDKRETGIDLSSLIYDNSDDRISIVELINPSNDLYTNEYGQKLQIISSIYPLNETAETYGDTYLSYFTFRATTPSNQYKYGTSNASEDSNGRVLMWIITLPIESKLNIVARYSKNQIDKSWKLHFDNPKDHIVDREKLYRISYKIDNFINGDTGRGYSVVYNENGIQDYVYFQTIENIHNYINRIVRSDVINQESTSLTWRYFRANEYKDLPVNRGAIVSLKTDNKNIYIQQEYGLRLASLRDTLGNTNEGSSYLGSSDVFDREPSEILYSPNGYIGCKNIFDTHINVFGYFVVDAERGKIFQVYGEQANEISSVYCKQWFERNINKDVINNPFKTNGRYFNFNELSNTLHYIQHVAEEPICISFNCQLKRWISFHDYIPTFGINNRNNVIWFDINNDDFISYIVDKTIYGRFFNNIIYDSTFKFILNQDPIQNKLLNNITWKDLVTNRINNNIENVNWYNTIYKIAVHNEDQTSGFKDVTFNKIWYDGNNGVNKVNVWVFNNINDIAKSSDFLMNPINFDSTKLKINPKWYNVNKIISQFVNVIMKFNNSNLTQKYELQEIAAEWIADNRN